jgi:hypothetical protein
MSTREAAGPRAARSGMFRPVCSARTRPVKGTECGSPHTPSTHRREARGLGRRHGPQPPPEATRPTGRTGARSLPQPAKVGIRILEHRLGSGVDRRACESVTSMSIGRSLAHSSSPAARLQRGSLLPVPRLGLPDLRPWRPHRHALHHRPSRRALAMGFVSPDHHDERSAPVNRIAIALATAALWAIPASKQRAGP